MKNLQYKKVTTTTLKVGGILDADKMVIDGSEERPCRERV